MGGGGGGGLGGAVGGVAGSMGGMTGLVGGSGGPWGGLLGTAGGVAGTGIEGPAQAAVQTGGTTVEDVRKAQSGTSDSIKSQERLLKALQGQKGLQQQNAAAKDMRSLSTQMGNVGGLGAQASAIQGLQNTAGMYSDVAQGRGPNPAMAALNQQTGQNIANQTAMMAGQRGASANPALIARMAAQQGANTQQQAVGQGATMQAQQQLNALSGLTGTQSALGSLGTSQVAQQAAQQQAIANQANQVAGQQLGTTNNLVQSNLANQQAMQNALAGINTAKVGSQSSVNASNTALAGTQMQGQQAMLGGLLGGMGGAMSAAGAHGGDVVKMAEGGAVIPELEPPKEPIQSVQDPNANELQRLVTGQGPQMSVAPTPAAPQEAPTSTFTKFLQNAPQPKDPAIEPVTFDPKAQGWGSAKLEKGAEKLGSSIGKMFGAMAQGGLAETGGEVKAKSHHEKAVKSGDDYANDKINAKLSEGEIVLPRSVTMSKDPIRSSADFVAKVLAKRGMKK